jgi:hypothetical protein
LKHLSTQSKKLVGSLWDPGIRRKDTFSGEKLGEEHRRFGVECAHKILLMIIFSNLKILQTLYN